MKKLKQHILYYCDFIREMFDTNNSRLESNTQLKTTYTFNIGEVVYRVYFNNLKDRHYHLSFSAFIEGVETYDLLKETKHGLKVLSNVKNCVDVFIKLQKIDMLVYDSLDVEREYVYIKFAQYLKLSHFNNYYTKDYSINNQNIRVYLLVNKNIDYKYYLKDNYIENNIYQFMKKL